MPLFLSIGVEQIANAGRSQPRVIARLTEMLDDVLSVADDRHRPDLLACRRTLVGTAQTDRTTGGRPADPNTADSSGGWVASHRFALRILLRTGIAAAAYFRLVAGGPAGGAKLNFGGLNPLPRYVVEEIQVADVQVSYLTFGATHNGQPHVRGCLPPNRCSDSGSFTTPSHRSPDRWMGTNASLR